MLNELTVPLYEEIGRLKMDIFLNEKKQRNIVRYTEIIMVISMV